MKTKIFTILSIVAATCFVVSCQKDEIVGNVMTFTANIEQLTSNAKTQLASDNKSVEWVAGDQINLNGYIYTANGGGASTTFSGSEASAPYTAYYPASLRSGTGTPTLPYMQTYEADKISNLPMYAYLASGTNLQFKNICGVIELSLTHATKQIKSIAVTSTEFLSGPFSVSSNMAVVSGTGASKAVVLDCGSGVDISSATKFWIAIPAGIHKLTIRVNASDGTSFVKTMTSSQTIAVNHIYFINNWTLDTWTASVSGSFQGEGGRTLRFAKGNLNKVSSSYAIYSNPWEYINSDVVSERQDKDLFDWNTLNTEEHSFNIDGINWVVPTQDDWVAIIGTSRTGSTVNGTSGRHFAKVNLGGTNGLLLCPDGASFSLPSGVTISNWDQIEGAFPSSSNISTAQWATFDAAGCIFLPAAGSYNGSSVELVGDYGGYWSSSDDGGSSAYYLYFMSYALGHVNGNQALYFSVRLVEVQ